MKKSIKIVALLLVACMTFMLAGCDLFTQNNSAYLNQIVITATYNDGTKIEIDRREYLNAYDSYGSGLISSNGYSEEEAKNATVNALVNRKVLLKEAKADSSVVAKLQEKKSELYYQTYQALINNTKDYEADIKKDWEIEDADTMASGTKNGTVYKAYEKQAEVVYVKNAKDNNVYDKGEEFVDANDNGVYDNGESFTDTKSTYKIKKIEDTKTPVRDRNFTTIEQVKQEFYSETRDNANDAVAKEAYRRYLGSLKSSQNILGTNYTDDKLVEDEIQRIYDNLEENEYISIYQEQAQLNGGYSTITVQQVLNKYASMMGQSRFIYSNNNDSYKTDMLDNFGNVNYFIDNNYFHVAHILVKFSDEQQAEYDELEKLSNNGQGGVISSDYAEKREQELYASIKGSVRNAETGEITNDDEIAINDILSEINSKLEAATTNEQKDEAFRKLMYKYNEDDGIMNADYSYIIGTNDSKMVENFTNASRDLHNNGVYGAVSGLVQSEYGIHIIYYMGACENLFEFNSNNKLNLKDFYTYSDNGVEIETSDIFKLTETKLNNLNNKTVFDLVYEGLVKDNYSEFENVNLETIKNQKGIKIETNF